MTRNHAAYIAGSDSSVSTVATINPPMMATAIGPQKTLRDHAHRHLARAEAMALTVRDSFFNRDSTSEVIVEAASVNVMRRSSLSRVST